MRKPFYLAVLLFCCFFFTSPYAKTLLVDNKSTACSDVSGEPFCRIKAAIQSANPDDVIKISNGLYIETLLIEKNLKLVGEDKIKTILDGGKQSSVIEFSPGVRGQIKSLTIQNGYANNGGGILNKGSLLIENVIIKNNRAKSSGGGIYNSSSVSGSLYLKNSDVEHNYSLGNDKHNIKYGGGGIYNDAPLVIEDTLLQYNQAVDNGGGLYTIFSGRMRSSEGEIIAEKLGIGSVAKRQSTLKRIKDVGSVSITNSNINHNYADAGAGINVHGVLNISSSIISENHATNGFRSSGGGLFAHFDTNLNMNNVLVSHNKATFRGGGVRFYTVGFGKFSNVSIIDNVVLKDFGQGAGIFIIKGEKSLELQNTLIARNSVNQKTVDDCFGAFHSLGNNYLTTIEHCSGFDAKVDIHESLTGVDHLYQWDDVKEKYKTLGSSKLNDQGYSDGCKNEKGNTLKKDVYGNPRHVDGDGDGVATCDIGAIEYIPVPSRN